jgi:hypothetical protein
MADAERAAPQISYGIADTIQAVLDLLYAPFQRAALEVAVVAPLLVGGYLAVGVVRLRRGLREAASYLAWSAAMVVWAWSLVRSRSSFAEPHIFRYTYLTMGFALLAVVPRRPVAWRSHLLRPAGVRWGVAAGLVVLVFGLVRATAARPDLQAFARQHNEMGRDAEGTSLVVDQLPNEIPAETSIDFFGSVGEGTAARLRVLLDRYGAPFSDSPDPVDTQLVDRGLARVAVVGPAGSGPPCTPSGDIIQVDAGPHRFKVWSPERYTIALRRFGTEWVPAVTVPPGSLALLELPALHADDPWQVRAPGACVVP